MRTVQLLASLGIAALGCTTPEQLAAPTRSGDAGSAKGDDDDGAGSNPSQRNDDDGADDGGADDGGADDNAAGDDGLSAAPDDDAPAAGNGSAMPGRGSGGAAGSGGTGGVPSTGSGGSGAAAGAPNGGASSTGGSAGISGSACVAQLDCPYDEYCADGVCLPDQCPAGTSYCDGLDLTECDGRGYTLGWICESRCLEFGDFASCEATTCAPGAEFCIPGENLVRRCADDARTTEVIEDCAASGQVCVGSSCYPVICAPGERDCDGNRMLECSPEGHRMAGAGGCSVGRYCDPEAQACVPQVCPPNVAVCADGIATRCNDLGSGVLPDGIDCGETGEVCSNGECRPVICEPDTRYCEEYSLLECNAIGTAASIIESCQAVVEYCDPQALTCLPRGCSPNDAWCEGNLAYVCDALGASSGVTDCGLTDQFCLDAQCQDLECLPNSLSCGDDDRVWQCNATGTAAAVHHSCGDTQYCEGGSCHDQVCLPNFPGCHDDRAGVCNDQGSALLGGGELCSPPDTCRDGLCSDALFWDGFEDQRFYDWGGVISNVVSEVGLSSGANGSSTGVYVRRTAIPGFGNGLYHQFDAVVPTLVSWWALAPYLGWEVGYVELTLDTGEPLIRVHFSGSQIVVNTQSTGASYAANTWYPFELAIDWASSTVDVSFDSAVVLSDVPFGGEGSGIARLDLYCYDQDGIARFDEFELR